MILGSFFIVKLVNTFHSKVFISLLASFPCILSFVLVYLYSSNLKIVGFFDELLSHRISLAYSILDNYGISLLGQYIPLVSTTEARRTGLTALVLDNAYMHLLLRYGVVLFVVFILFYSYFIYISFEEKGILSMLIVFLYCGITETWLIRIEIDFLLVLFIPILLSNKLNQNKMLNSSLHD